MQKLNLYLSIILLSSILLACKNGGSPIATPTYTPTTKPTHTPQYESIAIPVSSYAGSKFAIYTKVGNGTPTLTEIDTGSDFLLIESSYVGSNIKMTNESITFTYDHGTNPRSGILGYTNVALLDSNMNALITTNDQVPVIVVPDGVVGNQGNHAIMGLRLNSNVSLKLFLPYPYNQMFIADFLNNKLIFGNFTNVSLYDFGKVNLESASCDNYQVTTSASAPCWNDMAIPVSYLISGNPTNQAEIINTLFDSGAGSSFQSLPLPTWFDVSSGGVLDNSVHATLNTSNGVKSIYLTSVINAFATNYNGDIVNVGNNIFNYYQVLFDQQHGTIGLK